MRRSDNLGEIKLSIWFDCLSLPSSIPVLQTPHWGIEWPLLVTDSTLEFAIGWKKRERVRIECIRALTVCCPITGVITLVRWFSSRLTFGGGRNWLFAMTILYIHKAPCLCIGTDISRPSVTKVTDTTRWSLKRNVITVVLALLTPVLQGGKSEA